MKNCYSGVISVVLLTLIPLLGWGQQTIIPPTNYVNTSFAIIIDQATYEACRAEIELYKQALEKDGLATFIITAKWESPEHVKFFLEKYYKEQALEGAVLIGDIPIPMIRRAQHLTSAFKMDEKKFSLRESSVPSDRFYDDFDLKFDLIAKDSLNLFYYYNLRGDSPQYINGDIYTGRIKPTQRGEQGYEQIRAYLKKTVIARSEENMLDNLCSYTGEGSFSNSLTAWRDEQITLREQIPAAFTDARNAKFYLFNMYPSMKEAVTKELQQPHTDLMLFHEHGMPHRQYLTGIPAAFTDDDCFDAAKRYLRGRLRRAVDAGKEIFPIKKEWMDRYQIDSSWFTESFDKEVIVKDSLEDLATGIILEDISGIKPNPRMVIFDACYNGDFREERFIAGEYVFAGGRNLVCWANSVNVLQDKSSSDLLGMLFCGARVGEWARNVNILESHIIGDPTFRFTTPSRMPKIRYHSQDSTYWLAVLGHNLPPDLKGLALHKLHALSYPQMPEMIREIFAKSESYMLRLQCLHLAAYYGGELYADMLKAGVKDPYEFIRRKSAYYMGKVGRNDFIPHLVDLYLNDFMSERITFNIFSVSGHLNGAIFKKVLKSRIDEENYIYDKEAFYAEAVRQLDAAARLRDSFWEEIVNTKLSPAKRMQSIVILRNNPYVQVVDDLLRIVSDPKEDSQIRIAIAEALGWYERSVRNRDIAVALNDVLQARQSLDAELTDELTKAINRLQTYRKGEDKL